LVKIERLLDAGATVVGSRPDSSPSLSDDPVAFEAVCDRIWDTDRTMGRAIQSNLTNALSDLEIRPAFEVAGARILHISRLVEGRRITFLSNPAAESIEVQLSFPRTSTSLVGWDPIHLRRTALETVTAADGRRTISVPLGPFGSVFAVEDDAANDEHIQERVPLSGDWELAIAGAAPIVTSPDPVLWTELADGESSLEVAGTYSHKFALEDVDPEGSIHLQFESLHDIASVTVNGIECGVIWTDPLRADVSRAVAPGVNRVEIGVIAPWRNRLIAEARNPTGEFFAPMVNVFEPTATPSPAGLTGKVYMLRS
jgi:hypothetical protein